MSKISFHKNRKKYELVQTGLSTFWKKPMRFYKLYRTVSKKPRFNRIFFQKFLDNLSNINYDYLNRKFLFPKKAKVLRMKNTNTSYFKLTKSENEIMDLMWKENRPLSRSEIIELTPDRTWKPASIHILLNSMLEKKAIEVAGFVQSTKNYARTFIPSVTADAYAIMQVKSSPVFSQDSIPSLVSSLLEEVTSMEILQQLEEMVQNKKKKL